MQRLAAHWACRYTGLLERHGFGGTDVRAASTPLTPNVKLGGDPTPRDATEAELGSYPAIVGSLLYLACATRPDLAFAAGALARFMSAPTGELVDEAHHALRYLRGTSRLELVLGGITSGARGAAAAPLLGAYSDSDFANCVDTLRSVSGAAIFVRNSPVLWRSSKLGSIVKSATAAEYVAASIASDDVVFLRNLLTEFEYDLPATPFRVDNSATVGILKSGKVDAKTKHLAVHWHCVRERQLEGVIDVEWVPTDENIADLFTKALGAPKLREFRAAMRLQQCG